MPMERGNENGEVVFKSSCLAPVILMGFKSNKALCVFTLPNKTLKSASLK